ncbi:MAG: hypothetical protein ACM3S1_14740 [Hyphomicrobiales bacterium]
MTVPQRVIYLPPGVVPSPQTPPSSGPIPIPAIPFDRNFFENILPQSIDAFCQQADCDSPIVELLTIDGATHYVKGISGVSDAWVALHTKREDHEHDVEVFLPYQTIYRVELHPAEDASRHRLGFLPPDQRHPTRIESARSASPAAAQKKGSKRSS